MNLVKQRLLYLCLWASLFIGGCATTQPQKISDNDAKILSEIHAYESTLGSQHPHLVENMFVVSDALKQQTRELFSQGSKHTRARDLAYWLVAPDGHNMTYDIDANFTPMEAYEKRRGNCLSFTILLVTLGNELGLNIDFNDVDLPNMWDMDEENGLIFYRHINAILNIKGHKQIFDLAMENYDHAYPQRTISQRAAGALLHSNLGVDALKRKENEQAFHHLKLAVSIDPSNADLWVNLGAAYKRSKKTDIAELIFRTALSVDTRHSLAASNLERLYREQGRTGLAKRYMNLAAQARLRNPYMHYKRAQKHYDAEEFKAARKSIKRAIALHDLDPKFFELSSLVNQQFRRYRPALLDLEKAFKLAKDIEERGRYYNKVKVVAKRAEQYALEQQERRVKRRERVQRTSSVQNLEAARNQ